MNNAANTITDEQIRAFQAAARAAGKKRLVKTCEYALDGDTESRVTVAGLIWDAARGDAPKPTRGRVNVQKLDHTTRNGEDLFSVTGDEGPGAIDQILILAKTHDPAYRRVRFFEVGEAEGESVYAVGR